MTKPVFYYANGTNFISNLFGEQFQPVSSPGGPTFNIRGLNGQFFEWDGYILSDPFPKLLDPALWDYDRVQYPASTISMNLSIQVGVEYIVQKILDTPVGTPFAVGGYSQGAAVAHRLVGETRAGRLMNRRQDLRACVTFGAPSRETNHTWVGSSGWSGADDVPNSTRGGHGTFPPLFRMQNTEDLVWDFVMPNEPITSVGDSFFGKLLQNFVGGSLNTFFNLIPTLLGVIPFLLYSAAVAVPPPGVAKNPADATQWAYTDPVTSTVRYFAGGGHTMYPFFPPPAADGSIPASGDTSYQIAARYLNSVGQRIYDELNFTPVLDGVTPSTVWVQTA